MKNTSLLSVAVMAALGIAVSGCSSHSDKDNAFPKANASSSAVSNSATNSSQNAANESASTTNAPKGETAKPAMGEQSGGKHNGATSPSTSATPNPPAGNQPSTAVMPSGDKYTGVAYHFNSAPKSNQITSARLLKLTTDDLNVLYADGKRIEMAPAGRTPAYTFSNESNQIKLSSGVNADGSEAIHTAYGLYQDRNTGDTYVYAQGDLTPKDKMPMHGKVTYLGFGTHINNQLLNEKVPHSQDYPFGLPTGVEMTADFDAKTIEGQVLNTVAKDTLNVMTKLGGHIMDNTFSGEKDGTKLEGAFYQDGKGAMAKEIGGIYVNEKEGFSGSFSGKSW